jgi:hypothetical protein
MYSTDFRVVEKGRKVDYLKNVSLYSLGKTKECHDKPLSGLVVACRDPKQILSK